MSEQENPTKIISISLYGESDVGKTCICYSFLGLEFLDEHLSTVGIEKNNAEIESGETIKLKIWDTAGQERFRSISFNSLRKSNGCIVVFDLTEKSSFEKVTEWLKKIRENMPKIPIALFGNKNDLPNRKVTQEEIDELCKRENLIYFETSAKENKGIKEGFIKISTLACENLGKEDSVERGQNLKKDNKNKKKKKCC